MPAAQHGTSAVVTAPAASPDENSGADDPITTVAEGMQAPAPDTLRSLQPETLAPAAVPDTGAIADMQQAQAPDALSLRTIQTPQAQGRATVAEQSGALETPIPETAVSLDTDPPQPDEPLADTLSNPTPRDADAALKQDVAPDVMTDIAVLEVPDLVGEQGPMSSDPVPDVPVTYGTFGMDTALDLDTRDADEPAKSLPTAKVEPQIHVEKAPVVAAISDQPLQAPAAIYAAGAINPQADHTFETGSADPLSAPDVPGKVSLFKDSVNAQVEADVSVTGPVEALLPESVATLEMAIAPAPSLPALQPLGGVAPSEAAVVPSETIAPPVQDRGSHTVLVNRLPSLGGGTNPAQTGEEPAGDTADAEALRRPFELFAADFENPTAKPLMAVVLMDTGAGFTSVEAGLAILQELRFPISIAVDVRQPDATPRMRAYRNAGFEVLAAVDLPLGATAKDAEMNLSMVLQDAPEALGVLEGVETGVQTTADAGRQVAEILAQTGHGLVTQNRGLNSVQKLAARQGVPSGVVFRDFDSQDQTMIAMRRFLDQAAFRAGQAGGVIMLGRLKEETVRALAVWASQDRASTVALAPVSAVLTPR